MLRDRDDDRREEIAARTTRPYRKDQAPVAQGLTDSHFKRTRLSVEEPVGCRRTKIN